MNRQSRAEPRWRLDWLMALAFLFCGLLVLMPSSAAGCRHRRCIRNAPHPGRWEPFQPLIFPAVFSDPSAPACGCGAAQGAGLGTECKIVWANPMILW